MKIDAKAVVLVLKAMKELEVERRHSDAVCYTCSDHEFILNHDGSKTCYCSRCDGLTSYFLEG